VRVLRYVLDLARAQRLVDDDGDRASRQHTEVRRNGICSSAKKDGNPLARSDDV
jgi:hypothetical protein